MKLAKGIELLNETEGTGIVAVKGDCVTYNARLFLNKGDEVPLDREILGKYEVKEFLRDRIRTIDGCEFIDHQTILGKRRPIAGVEKSLFGMKAGGYREVRVGSHLAYRDVGIPNLIPPNALLRIQLWVRDVERGTKR